MDSSKFEKESGGDFRVSFGTEIPFEDSEDAILKFAIPQREKYMNEVYDKYVTKVGGETNPSEDLPAPRYTANFLAEQNIFNPRIYERNGNYFLGSAVVETSNPSVNLIDNDLATLQKVIDEVESYFPEGIKVRVLFREPTTYEKEKMGLPFEPSKRIIYLFVQK